MPSKRAKALKLALELHYFWQEVKNKSCYGRATYTYFTPHKEFVFHSKQAIRDMAKKIAQDALDG